MRRKLIILLLFYVNFSFSQDIHFSQNFADRMYYNPALVGDLEDNDYRISIQRRSQWQSVSVPFSTFSASFENKLLYKNFNLGIQFFNDKSGDSKLTLNQINLSISRRFNIRKLNSFLVGGIIGLGQKKIDYTNLIFEQNEELFSNNFLYPDIGCGIYYKTNTHKIFSYNLGISIYHLNNPLNSFTENEIGNLPLKNNLSFGVNYKYQEEVLITSELLMTNQGPQKEIVVGLKPQIKLNQIILFPFAYYRINDAAILGFGLEKDNIQANISYDINISDLHPASNNMGGFEFSIIYLWEKKKKPVKLKEKICPKYL